jgi:integral membrane sensor domain MASE1
VLGVGLVYYLTARLGLLIPYIGTHVSLVWLPTGVALAAYLRWGAAMMPGILAAAVAAPHTAGKTSSRTCTDACPLPMMTDMRRAAP